MGFGFRVQVSGFGCFAVLGFRGLVLGLKKIGLIRIGPTRTGTPIVLQELA